jgi:hypothetical protein
MPLMPPNTTHILRSIYKTILENIIICPGSYYVEQEQ